AARYSEGLQGRVIVPECPEGYQSVWAQYTLRIKNRDAVMETLRKDGVPTNVYYPRPIHEQPAYCNYPVAEGGTPVATRLAREVLSLP
ncbi:DegT/DnrJ/EryC1/StrS family aminotransferase, partial [Vibrio parahaemolyticus]|uniref:DegT/DnrJ/EryC1/StrS family aminotransferase n=1 Tax=Vibrio parahaemolyticus TaxID=670 RepID=UPI002114E0A6